MKDINDETGVLSSKIDKPMLVVDKRTGHRYTNEPKTRLRIGHVVAVCLAPVTCAVYVCTTAITNAVRLISFYHFWSSERAPTFLGKCERVAKDVGRIAISPLTSVAHIFASVYGIFAPQDGWKINVNLSRLETGMSIRGTPISKKNFDLVSLLHGAKRDIWSMTSSPPVGEADATPV